MSRGAACGPPFGMGLDVESSGAGDELPPGLWFLLGFRCVTGQSGVNIVHMFCFGQGVRVTFCCRWLDAAKADGEFSQRLGRFANRPYGGGESRLGGGVRLQEGWIPASAGKTDGGWRCGAVPARPFDPPQRTYSKLRVSGPSQGWIHGSGAGMGGRKGWGAF